MTEDLNEFFSSIGKAKKEKEEELNSIIGEVSVDSIFSEASKELVKDKKEKEEKEIEKKKKLEKEKRQTKALEEWLYSDTKTEEVNYKQRDKELKKTSVARNERYNLLKATCKKNNKCRCK